MTEEMKNKIQRELKTGRIWRKVNQYSVFCTYVIIQVCSEMTGAFEMYVGVSPDEVKARRVII